MSPTSNHLPNNQLPVDPAQVSLTRSDFVALVDAADLPLIEGIAWGLHGSGRYAYGRHVVGGKNRTVLMHRLIVGAACKGSQVDHINGNGLDNRRVNLRVASPFQNNQNKRPHSVNHRFKGITAGPRGRNQTYTAGIYAFGRKTHLGTFETIEEAASAYDIAAVLRFGEFANLNYPHVFPELPRSRMGASRLVSSQ